MSNVREYTIEKIQPGDKFKFEQSGLDQQGNNVWLEEFVLLEKKKIDNDSWSIVFDPVNPTAIGVFEICAVVKEDIELELIN
jgi:hypothetical protein